MTRLLLDTHVWIWYALGSKDLPRSLLTALDDAVGRCWLSPISVWEAWLLIKKDRFRVQGTYEHWLDQALEAIPLREAAFNIEVARTVSSLDLPHNDPADHFIAATAMVYDLTLVTLDRHLVAAPWLPTLTS